MVSETQNDVSTITGHNRGFIPEETVVAAGPGIAATTYYRPFWRPVLAGAIFTISVCALSWYLMLGCGVGVSNGAVLNLGLGAAIWLWVTACIAYYFGGMIASAMTASSSTIDSYSSGWLKGAVLWGVSIPMALIIYALVARSGIVMDLNLPHVSPLENASPIGTGFYWSAFVTLGLALIFSLVGGVTGCACRKGST